MALVSQAKYAELHGVSRKTVTKWKASGYLTLTDSFVDVEASDIRLKEFGLGRFAKTVTPSKGNKQGNSRPASNTGTKPAPSKPPPRPKTGDEEEDLGSTDLDLLPADFLEGLLAGRVQPMPIAERLKENGLAGQRLLEMLKKAGLQVDLPDAEEVFFEQARSNRDAWLNWPTRVAPMLAADLGIDASVLTEHLIKHVQQHLGELGEPNADFGGQGSEA